MAAKLSLQLNQHQRRFLFSAMSPDLEKCLHQKVESLQGRVVLPTTNTFSSMCTHVIAQEFSPTEKILGALAGGKWLLTANYIHDSYKKGYWLREERYEYTSFNEVAAYHRCNWIVRNCGPYEGWTILVVMDSPKTTRTFNRILSAGGAEIASKKDTGDVDFVLTKPEVVKYAQTLVNSCVPLVDVTYVKNTLLFRNDPTDLKKCDLRDQQDFEIPSKSVVTTSCQTKSDNKTQGYRASPRKPEPAPETLLAKKKQINMTKQTTMTQFLKPTIKEPSPNKITREDKRETSSQDKYLPIISSPVRSSRCHPELRLPVIVDVEDDPQAIKKRRLLDTETNSRSKDQLKVTPVNIKPLPPTTQYGHFKLRECSVVLPKTFPALLQKHPRELSFTNHVLTEESEAVHLKSSDFNTVSSPEMKKRADAVLSVSHECSPASFPELNKGGVPPKTPSFTMTKSDTKKAILNFIRTRECLNKVCCTNLCLIPTESIERESCKRDIQKDSVISDEPREMTKREINLYTCFLAPELRDKEFEIHGLDFLLGQLSSYVYPPPAIMGSLLKDLILETPSRLVHSRAHRVAYRVLTMHPPTTKKMRKYYLRMLEKAMQDNGSGRNIAWSFIQRVIHCALKDNDKTISSPDTEEDHIDGARKALNLLQFLITLIVEDTKNSPYGEAVQELLIWDIFMGPSRTCNVLTLPVKQLLQLYISQETSIVLMMSLAHLVTLVLEVMWKLSGHPLVPVTALPDTLAVVAKEMQLCCKGLSFEKRLEVVRSLPSPWSQCVVSSIFLQEAMECPRKLTLASIVDLFFSTSNYGKNGEIYKPESPKQVGNNLSHKEKEESPMAHRGSSPNINKNSKCNSLTPNINGADVKQKRAPLLTAVIGNRVKSVKSLLDDGGEDLLRTRTKDGKTAFDLAPSKEMLMLLTKYKRKSSGCIPKGISPTMEDQKYHRQLLVSLANSYLEVSGNRYIYYTITKCISKVAKENIEREKTKTDTKMDHDEHQKVGKQAIKEVRQKNNKLQQFILIENESLENVSELEEMAFVKVFKGLLGDKVVLKKWLLHNSALVKKADGRHLFRTLCL